MKQKFKKIPHFESEAQEREFWQKADSSQYFDFSKAKHVSFPNLKLTSKPITIRMHVSLINTIKAEANRQDMPYQSLIKQTLYNRFCPC